MLFGIFFGSYTVFFIFLNILLHLLCHSYFFLFIVVSNNSRHLRGGEGGYQSARGRGKYNGHTLTLTFNVYIRPPASLTPPPVPSSYAKLLLLL